MNNACAMTAIGLDLGVFGNFEIIKALSTVFFSRTENRFRSLLFRLGSYKK